MWNSVSRKFVNKKIFLIRSREVLNALLSLNDLYTWRLLQNVNISVHRIEI